MPAERRHERAQRVRIGLTGLAGVFLLVLLAAAFLGFTNDERKTGPLIVTETGASPENGAVPAPREPLAELGVAPGYSGDVTVTNGVVTSSPPAPSAPPTIDAPAPRPEAAAP